MFYSKLILSSSKFILALFIGAALLLSGCGNEESSDITGGNGATIEHSSNITSDETWAKGDIHIIKGTVTVTNAILTIQPGAIVKFASNARLVIDNAGGLIADGATEAITFTGETAQAGYWYYIEFQDDAANQNCKMINCIVEYGGGYNNSAAMIYIENSPTISNCTFRYSSSNGVKIDGDADPNFSGNTITSNALSPIIGYFKSAPSIGYGNYTGNEQDYINLYGGQILKTSTLKKIDVPYNLNSTNTIKNGILTIEAGANFTMDSDSRLVVGENGGLLAQGNAANIITFTGKVQQKGYWYYIEFQNDAASANCKMSYCLVEYGGGYNGTASMIYVYNNASITNNIIRNSSSHGIEFDENSEPVFFGNTITLNDLSPVLADFENITYLGTGDYSGNTNDYLDIKGGMFSKEATLKKQNVPYRLNSTNTIKNGMLTIEAGTTILMNSDSRITVDQNGGLIADGTSETITFSGYVQQKGYWYFIEFQDDASAANCTLSHCLVEYGGGYNLGSSMIYIDNDATVTNCTIQHSSSWGLSYDDLCSPTLSGNVYVDNDAGDVKTH